MEDGKEESCGDNWLMEKFAEQIREASGSLKMARDGKTPACRPRRNLRLIPKAKAKHWLDKAGKTPDWEFFEKVHSEPDCPHSMENASAEAIYDRYVAGYNGYYGGDALLKAFGLEPMASNKLEIVSNNVERTGWISKSRRIFGCSPKVGVILGKWNLPYVMFLDAVEQYFWEPCKDLEPYRIFYLGARRWRLEAGIAKRYAKDFYSEDVSENVERIFTIGKVRRRELLSRKNPKEGKKQ